VAKSSLSKSGSFWRTDWFAGVAIVLAVVVLNQATDAFDAMERRFYDFASTSTSRQPSDRIAVIAIDDQSIANLGRWPWSRDIHAKLIDKLAAAKAKTIAQTTFFLEPQVDPGLLSFAK
jgi:CHASE2 domain-containing sensor protein